MMALHCRSRGRSCSLFSGQARAADPVMPNWVYPCYTSESSRMNRQKVVLHRAGATLDKIHSASSIMETSHVARSERSPLRIVFAENEPEGARTEGSGDREMKYRRATIVADDWHGEFRSYDEWARLGPQPPYRTATFFDAHGRRCITQRDFARARDDRAFPLRYRWERTEPR